MKFLALLGAANAIALRESPDIQTSEDIFAWHSNMPTAAGFVELSACSSSGINGAGLTCVPDHQLFATGMNGDEDLGQDIIMKGKPFHYNQQPQALFATGMNGDEDLGQDIIMKGKPFHYNQH